jgi:Right handed beta helix region
VRHPFATVSRLVSALRRGQTGCLLGGAYEDDVVLRRGGTVRAPITLRAYPGATVRIKGTLDWERGAPYWRVSGLTIDGSSSSESTIAIHDDGIRLDHNDITNENQGGSCVLIGNVEHGTGRGTVVDHNRIHDCGGASSPELYHGVYLCCGQQVRIASNLIWHNSGYGVQLYPDADGARVDHNVIDGSRLKSGVTIGGDEYGACYATSDAVVSDNIITSNAAYGVNTHWGCKVGSGNRVLHNCLWGNRLGTITPDAEGITASGNLRVNPHFTAPEYRDFRLRRGSRCRRMAPQGRVGPKR